MVERLEVDELGCFVGVGIFKVPQHLGFDIFNLV